MCPPPSECYAVTVKTTNFTYFIADQNYRTNGFCHVISKIHTYEDVEYNLTNRYVAKVAPVTFPLYKQQYPCFSTYTSRLFLTSSDLCHVNIVCVMFLRWFCLTPAYSLQINYMHIAANLNGSGSSSSTNDFVAFFLQITTTL